MAPNKVAKATASARTRAAHRSKAAPCPQAGLSWTAPRQEGMPGPTLRRKAHPPSAGSLLQLPLCACGSREGGRGGQLLSPAPFFPHAGPAPGSGKAGTLPEWKTRNQHGPLWDGQVHPLLSWGSEKSKAKGWHCPQSSNREADHLPSPPPPRTRCPPAQSHKRLALLARLARVSHPAVGTSQTACRPQEGPPPGARWAGLVPRF